MNFIKNLHNNISDSYYKNIYNFFLNNDKNNENNENILIINHNYFNPLLYYSHFLKKYNINLYIIFNNEKSRIKLENDINNEECKNLIHYNLNNFEDIVTDYINLKFNKIILLHIKSINFLNNNLVLSEYFKSELFIFISLTNKNKVSYKNTLRNIYKNITYNEYGNVFDYDEIFNLLNSNTKFEILKINMISDNHYITYGSHKLYLFHLKFKNI